MPDTIIEFRARRTPKSGVIIQMGSGTSFMTGGQNRLGGGSGVPGGGGSNFAKADGSCTGVREVWRSCPARPQSPQKSIAQKKGIKQMPVKNGMKVKCGINTVTSLTVLGVQGLAA